jgi:methylmalonyl-CoA mutase
MSQHPDFTQIGLGQPDIQPGPPPERAPHMTAEELPIQPAYTSEDVAGLDFGALSSRPLPHHVRPAPLDDPPICGLLDG